MTVGTLRQSSFCLARLIRTNQWLKNAVVFISIIFSGNLFDLVALFRAVTAFIVFCLLSSASYIFNDLKDVDADRRHPVKKNRPIASGEISEKGAKILMACCVVISFVISLTVSKYFFLLSVVFFVLHVLYSLALKNFAVVDIYTISFSFMIRTYAGVVATGFHVPVWLLLTIFFMSLFVASIKRHAELVLAGVEARLTLAKYNKNFLDFLTYTFATATIIAYSLYSYIEQPPQVRTLFTDLLSPIFPGFEGRKLMTATIPIVVYVIARYGQLFYTRVQGERPEKIMISDVPLVGAIVIWAGMVITLIYLL